MSQNAYSVLKMVLNASKTSVHVSRYYFEYYFNVNSFISQMGN